MVYSNPVLLTQFCIKSVWFCWLFIQSDNFVFKFWICSWLIGTWRVKGLEYAVPAIQLSKRSTFKRIIFWIYTFVEKVYYSWFAFAISFHPSLVFCCHWNCNLFFSCKTLLFLNTGINVMGLFKDMLTTLLFNALFS